MTTVDRIKKLAKQYDLSLQEVAEKAGMGKNNIYRWNRVTPSTESLQQVAAILNTSMSYLLGETDDSSSPDTSKKTVDVDDDQVIMTFDGKPIPEEDMEIIKRLLRGKE